MERIGGEHGGQRASIRQVALASFVGTALEWYDYFLYATAAALVFNQLFFPEFSSTAGTLASFATFAVGFFARPVGGIVFGHFGDRVGRKAMLVITLLIMGGATALIGLLPTFDTIGLFASVLLVLLRFLQGFAVGGEWGGAVLMAVEHAPEEQRNFWASWPQLGSPGGLILSSAVFTIFSSLPDEQFFSWGWRVPFLLSIVLIGVGLFIRLRILESPAFAQVREAGTQTRIPLLEVLRRYPVALLLSIGVVLINIGGFYIVTTFTASYVTETLGLPRYIPLVGLFFAGFGNGIGVLAFAALADRVGRRPVALWSAAAVVVLSIPFFWAVDTEVAAVIWFAMFLWTGAAGALYGITGALLAELFEARVRYSGISFSYQMAGVLGGALAPLVSTALVGWVGGVSWPVAVYLCAMALITLVSVYLASDEYRVQVRPEESRQAT